MLNINITVSINYKESNWHNCNACSTTTAKNILI